MRTEWKLNFFFGLYVMWISYDSIYFIKHFDIDKT